MRLLIILFFVFLTSCVYRSTYQADKIVVLPENPKSPCALIGQVEGSSGYHFLAVGTDIAKDRARKQAAEIDATHIVWSDIGSNNNTYAIARAYRCPKS